MIIFYILLTLSCCAVALIVHGVRNCDDFLAFVGSFLTIGLTGALIMVMCLNNVSHETSLIEENVLKVENKPNSYNVKLIITDKGNIHEISEDHYNYISQYQKIIALTNRKNILGISLNDQFSLKETIKLNNEQRSTIK